MEVEDDLMNISETLGEYFNKIKDTLKEYVFIPTVNNFIPSMWKNNHCESMNHIIKLSCNWKSLRMTELTERLHNIVKLQYADLRRSIYGQGNYELRGINAKYRVTQSVWNSMNEEKKNEHFNKFMARNKVEGTSVTSTDMLLTIPSMSRTARKPGQRKRAPSGRTISIRGAEK